MDLSQFSGTCRYGYPSPSNFPAEFTSFAYSPSYSHVDIDEGNIMEFDDLYESLEFLHCTTLDSNSSQTSSAKLTTPLYAHQNSFIDPVNPVDGYGFEQVQKPWPSQFSTGNYMKFDEGEQEGALVDSVVGSFAEKAIDFNIAGNSLIASSRLVFDGTCILKERMMHALHIIKQSTDEGVLLQIWTPLRIGGKQVLSTYEQPFVLDAGIHNLVKYRNVSMEFSFSTDETNFRNFGLPGRVFQSKLPEWTPNAQYYSSEEYLRWFHAIKYDVRGSLAVPVFESGQRNCLGVLELVLTSNKIKFETDLSKVSKALEAVDLKTSHPDCIPNMKMHNKSYLDEMAEIYEVLTTVCEKYKLPLAQTWIPCRQGGVSNLANSSDKASKLDGHHSQQVFLLTRNKASYLLDAGLQDFRKACIEHHLTLEQGIVGSAFTSRRPILHQNISQVAKSEHPLVHYARMFELVGAVAIPVRCMKKIADVCILEFFLPPECKDTQQQGFLFESILSSIREFQRTSLLVSMELSSVEKSEVSTNYCSNEKYSAGELNCQPCSEQERLDELAPGGRKEIVKDESLPESTINRSLDMVGANISVSSNPLTKFTPEGSLNQQVERTRGKTEKTISIDVLKQYFAGSLKDASKCLGVCPTTLKRICRQQGIARWPSRKISKINNSLRKLQEVIESVKYVQVPSTLGACASSFAPVVSKALPLSTSTDLVAKESSKAVVASSNLETLEADRDDAVSRSQFPSSHDRINHTSVKGTSSSLGLKDRNKSGLTCSVLKTTNAEDCSEDIQVPPSYRNMKIKVVYKEDVVRLQLPLGSGLEELLKEVSKKLKVNAGSTHIKYLDSVFQWVTLTCDADLYECIQKSKPAPGNLIRLTVDDNK